MIAAVAYFIVPFLLCLALEKSGLATRERELEFCPAWLTRWWNAGEPEDPYA